MFRSMILSASALLAMLAYPVVMPATGYAEAPTTFSAPECYWETYEATSGLTLELQACDRQPDDCAEDDPCWRWWMGNGCAVLTPETLYMFLPFGPQWDALAPVFGYRADA